MANRLSHTTSKDGDYGYAFASSAFISVWILALFGGVTWSSADDPVISWMISQTAQDGAPFQQRTVVFFLNYLYGSISGLNWWLIANILCISVGISTTVYVLSKDCSLCFTCIFTFVSVFTAYFFVLRAMNFTYSSLITGCGGLMLIARSTLKGFHVGEHIMGVMLLLTGVSIREEAGFIAVGFLCAVGITGVDYSSVRSLLAFIRENRKKAVLLIIPVLGCLTFIAINCMLETDSEKDYLRYYHAIGNIVDYESSYPAYRECEEEYEALGLSENDYNLLFYRWVFDDTEVFSIEQLKQIGSLKFARMQLSDHIRKMLSALNMLFKYNFSVVPILLGLIMTAYAVIQSKKKRIQVAVIWLAAFLFIIYTVFLGRIVLHVVFSILWGMDCCLAFLCSKENNNRTYYESDKSKPKTGQMIFSLLSLPVATIIAVLMLKATGNVLHTPGNDYGSSDNPNRTLYDELDSRKDDVFILAPNLNKHFSLAYGPWSAFPKEYCNNVFYLGGWQARTGFCVQNLADRGIVNPMRALLENRNVFSMMDEKTDEIVLFLREHYDKTASYSIVENLYGNQIIRYCSLVDDNNCKNSYSGCAAYSATLDRSAGKPVINIYGELAEIEKVEDIFCTIKAGSDKYSYALAFDGDRIFNGRLVLLSDINAEPELDTIDIIIYTENDEYIKLASVPSLEGVQEHENEKTS